MRIVNHAKFLYDLNQKVNTPASIYCSVALELSTDIAPSPWMSSPYILECT